MPERVSLGMMSKLPLVIYLFVVFANFWIWKIFKTDFTFGIALVCLSFLLFFFIHFKLRKRLIIVGMLFLITFLSLKIFSEGFDNHFKSLSTDQERLLGERHGYFAVELGPLFQNKVMLRFYKDIYPYFNIYEGNLFNALSPNLYFFENHPREREKVHEFAMYPSILIMPFIIGIFLSIKRRSRIVGIYTLFAILISGFIKQDFIFGPVFFYPVINLLIVNGLLAIYGRIKK